MSKKKVALFGTLALAGTAGLVWKLRRRSKAA